MASSITHRDIMKVHALLQENLVGAPSEDEHFCTHDGWDILISGWSLHQKGWSRGFMISGKAPLSKGHLSPSHDGGRYEGRGWHSRMANDIVALIKKLRGVQETPTSAWGGHVHPTDD